MVARLANLHFHKMVTNLRMLALETGKRELVLELANLYSAEVLLEVVK
jgi:hypothetical protein